MDNTQEGEVPPDKQNAVHGLISLGKKGGLPGDSETESDISCRDRSRSREGKKDETKAEGRSRRSKVQEKNPKKIVIKTIETKEVSTEKMEVPTEKKEATTSKKKATGVALKCIGEGGQVCYKTLQELAIDEIKRKALEKEQEKRRNEERKAKKRQNTEDEDGWLIPGKKHTASRRHQKNEDTLTESDQDKDNRYTSLDKLNIEVEEIVENMDTEEIEVPVIEKEINNVNTPKGAQRDFKISTKTTKNITEKSTEGSDNNKKGKNAPFCPPFVLSNERFNVSLFSSDMKELNIEFRVTQINYSKMKIQIRKYEDYSRVKAILDKNHVKYYTYTPKEEKYYSVLMKGLHYSWKIDEVEKEFGELFPHTFYRISRFETKNSHGKYRLNIAKIDIKPNNEVSIDKVLNTKYFLNQVVSWERLKSKGPIQCRNCLTYGHIAINCKRQQLCVKCGKKGHGALDCKIPKDANPEMLTCARCGEKGHPASYRGCIAYRKLIEKINNKKENGNNRGAVRTPQNYNRVNTVKPGVSYAAALRGTTNEENARMNAGIQYNMNAANNSNRDKYTGNLVGHFLEEAENLFGMPYEELAYRCI